MNSKQIIIAQKKQISSVDKAKLAKAGIIVIEAENPEKVQLLSIAENVNANDYLMAALYSIAVGSLDSDAKKFVKELHRRLAEKEKILNEAAVSDGNV